MNINNSKYNMILTGTDGNDSISNSGKSVKINAMDGNDSIKNNYGDSVTINADAGNDFISNSGWQVSIEAGAGHDSISNRRSYVTISGNEGNDSIYNDEYAKLVSISGGAGNDSIYNNYNAELVSISGGAGNDSVENSGCYVSISGGADDDFISSNKDGDFVSIDGADGNDKISVNGGLRSYISGGTGNDSITNDGNYATIATSAGNDSIQNNGSNSTITGGDGNDSINNNYFGDSVTINADAGNDFISNSGWQVSINGGAGDDSISNSRSYATISGNEGNDSISNSSNSVTINADAGNDFISNSSWQVSINGGAGNDSIYNAHDGNTISGGTGNDLISLKSGGSENLIIYNTGDGNDLIEGFNEDSSLSIAGNYTSQVSGNDIIFTVGNGKITLQGGATLSDIIVVENPLNTINSANNKNIIGTNAPDTIKNSGQNVTIQSKNGNDSIQNDGSKVTIDSGNGNDYIYNTANSVSIDVGNGSDSIYNDGSFVTIDADGIQRNYISNTANNVLITGGKDHDTIHNSGSNVTIAGDADNDSIYNTGSNVTINSGTGNDYIYNTGANVLFKYSAGDGFDVIEGFNEDSSLSIAGNYTSQVSGFDIIVTVGKGKITLTGAASLSKVNIVETPINISNTANNTLITGKNAPDTITNSGQNVTIQAQGGNDSIKNSGSQVIIDGGEGSDVIDNSGSNVLLNYSKGNGNDLITGFNATSTLSIAGGHATTTKSGNDIIVTVEDGKITLANAASLSAVNIVETPLNLNNDKSNATVYGTNTNDTIKNSGQNVTINALGGKDSIQNEGSKVTINSGTGDDYIYNHNDGANVMINGGADNDSIENDGASITVDGGAGNDFIRNWGDSVTIDGGTGDDFISNNAASVSISGGADNDSIQNTGKNTTVDGDAGNDFISNNAASVVISGGTGNDSIQNTGKNTTLEGSAGNDSINNTGASVTIDDGAGDDFISNSGSNVTILGNEGNDNISLTSNAANNLIRYYSGNGNDVIQGFNETSTLVIADKPCTSAKSGSDIIITIEDTDEKITLKGAANLSIVNIDTLLDIENTVDNTIITGTGANDYIENIGENVTINALGGNDTIDNAGASSTIDGGEGNDSIQNSWNASGSIIGGAGDDTIDNAGASVTVDGGAGSDSISNAGDDAILSGNAGDDFISNEGKNVMLFGNASLDTISNTGNNAIISGNAGDDSISNTGDNVTFIYTPGDGNDVIDGFKDNSALIISEKTQYSTTKSGSNIIVTIGENKITLTGAANLSNLNITVPLNTKNTADSTVITGTEADDNINNKGKYVTINALGGNDSIYNKNYYAVINAGTGNDSIENQAARATIDLSTGNDYVFNLSDGSSIAGGSGNDYFYTDSKETTINAGKGDDYIRNLGANVFRYAEGDGNDAINDEGNEENATLDIYDGFYNSVRSGENIIVTVGDGKITLSNEKGYDLLKDIHINGIENVLVNRTNYTDNILIGAANYNDTVINSGSNVTVITNGGEDYISNSGKYVTIDGGKGNDFISNHNNGDYTTLSGGKGNDTIENNGDTVSISGGAGHDSIFSYSFDSTIAGGAGKDTISLSSFGRNNSIQYKAGEGNDVIYGFNENSTLDIDSSNYALIPSGSDMIVRLDDGEVTLKGAMNLYRINIRGMLDKPLNTNSNANNVLIFSGNYDDNISNSGQNVTILAQAGLDTISNAGNKALILAQADNDCIDNTGASVSIDGSAGNDYIANRNPNAANSSIAGGAGSDTLYNFQANYVSIAGGAGNDSIYDKSWYSTIDAGDGNDTIASYRSGKDTSIDAGAGNDIVSLDNNDGPITVKGSKGDDSIFANSNNNHAILYQYISGDGNDLITGFKADSTLSIASGHAITTKSGSDIIVSVGEGHVTLQGAASLSKINIVETPLNLNNDKSNATVYGTNTNDTIINTGDKVAILALNGKDSLENNAAMVSIDAGADDDFISNNGKNATISANAGNDSISNHSTRDLIVGSAGNDSIFNNGRRNTIDAGDGNDSIENYKGSEEVSITSGAGNDYIQNAGNKVTLSGGAGKDSIINDYGVSNLILGEDGSDLISIQGAYRNTIISGKGSDTVNLDWSSNKTFIQYNIGDGSDVIEGFNATSTLQIGDGNETYNKSIEGDDVIITVGKEKITLKGAADLARLNIVGVVKLIADNTKNEVELTGGRLDDSVKNSGNDVTISGGAGNDSVENSGRYVSISGGADADFISSNKDGDFVSIDGADGNDKISVNSGFRSYISGGTGNDSIYIPQTGDALIQYNKGDGNDYIEGFNATSTLQIGDGTDTFSKTVKSGNVIITTGEGQITLAGAASVSPLYIRGVEEIAGISTINHDLNKVINGTEGNDTITNYARNVTISGNGGKDSIVNTSDNVSINAGTGDDTILNNDTANDSESITLEGDEGNDLIENKADFVVISGGTGSDSINNSGANVVFNYTFGDGSDVIYGFNNTSTLNIAGVEFTSAKSGSDIVITMGGGNVTLKDAAKLSTVNVVHAKIENPLDTVSTQDRTLIVGTSLGDTISNKGRYVTIQAAGGKDSIYNTGTNNIIDASAGNDSINNDYGLFTSISGGAGNDLITVTSSNKVTVNASNGNDKIYLNRNSNLLLEYKSGDGNDFIEGFSEDSTLNIEGVEFTSAKSGNDIIITVGDDKITLDGAAKLSTLNIINGTYVNFTIEDSKVNYDTDIPESVIKAAYKFNKDLSLFTLDNSALKNYAVAVENGEDSAVKVNWNYGSASLSSDSTLEYQIDKGKNVLTLTSNNYGDKITFSEEATFTYGDIQADVLKGSAISAKSDQRISFDNNSSAKVEAPEDTQIDIAASNITVNDLPINSENGAGTITVTDNGMSFNGYGVQFADLEIAKESYFGKLAPMTVNYNSDDESYTIQNMACVKTLLDDFTKITFDISDAENYAYYKVNDIEFLVASDAEDINVVETDGTTFKIQDKEIDAENIGRVTIDEQITFSGIEIDFDGVKTNYALNKPVIYSLDGEEITINDAATIETGDETKTFNCEAGSYVVNGKIFETTADLTFSADASEIKIPLSDAATEIYFDGVQVSGISDGGEIVFDLDNDEISIPDGAIINFTSHDDIKLNLAAGNFTIDEKRISSDTELEITANKENLKVPLSENPVTINDAKITGTGDLTIDNTDAIFFSILLPDGALVQNTSNNTFELTGEGSSASFGDENKKVQLTEDGTAYIEFDNEKGIGVGFNTMMFEHVEIEGVDAWTVETSGTSGIEKITGITDGATVSTSTEDIDAGDLRFEVETEGAGEFTIAGEKITTTGDATYVVYGNSDGEIKVAPLGEEYADDDSEAAGKTYQYDTAGNHTVNGITFHATENSKVQTITRGIEFDLSSGTFQYDGLTLNGGGTAQINRYNAKLVSLTDGAIVSNNDATKYQNRQFEIEGAVEIIGKKFETDKKIRCALINVSDYLEFEIDGETIKIPFTLSGFIANDKYVQIHNDCYDYVKVVDKKLSSIEGVKNSAHITGNGLSNITIVTTESGEFSIHGRRYEISNDSDGVTFVTGSHGNVIEINGLEGSVKGDFASGISINGKAIQITGASSIKVTSDGDNITEISNVAGDLVTADDKIYRKNVRVYELGGAEKLMTSADGTIIFSGNKFETSAGKTFEFDEEGNVSGIEKAQSDDVVSAENVEENFATMNLSTTNGLEEIFGNFSEGLTVNGVFVKVTDSTNFVVKDDDESVYIETTAPDTFTINGKSFKTSADKTIFKLDASGNVSEIVTDSFYPNKEAYSIEGNFNDEIIFNGKKFCVTGTNDTSIFIGDETLITINLARNIIKIVECGGEAKIALSGEGDINIGDKTLSTSNGFVGSLRASSEGLVDSVENFVGTIEGKLGGLELYGITIDSDDNFSVTGDGEKITAINNLQNGTFTCGNLDGLTINGLKVSVDNSDEVTVEVSDGELKISGLLNGANISSTDGKIKFVTDESGEYFVNDTMLTAKANDTFIGTSDSAKIIDASAEEISYPENAKVITENTTLKGGEVVAVEDTSAKVKITASKGQDTIYTTGKNVDIDLKGGATKIYAAGGRATVENYKATSGAGFITDYSDLNSAIDSGAISFRKGKLKIDSAVVDLGASSELINFYDAVDDLQKVGFASDDAKFDASNETENLILVGGKGSTLAGGKGHNQIRLEENSESTILLNGKNTIENFNASFDGDKISIGAATYDFSFDGANISVKSGAARALLQNISSDDDAARILTLINGKEVKTAIAQAGAVITVSDELADIYVGKKSGVDFTGFNDSLTVDLNENFYGINQVTLGGGQNTLLSSSRNETLTSNGSTEFIFGKDSGRDVIKNFNFDADTISVGNETITAVNVNSSGGVRMEISGSATLTLEDAQGKNFRINNFVALVDKNLTYNAEANYFVATSQNASVIVNEGAEIWLDGSHGKTFVGDIRTLNASTAQGNTSLVGNDLDNTILAGNGDSSLWGGNAGDDLLVGGAGKNTFFYTNGNGSDTITGANNGDVINLSQVTLEQIASTSITADAVTLNFKNGGSLQVNSAADITYQLADGSKFSANHAQATWIAK